ncbi:fructose-bisphosphate aldolase, class II [Nannochloropsis gaditana CCMP526]|uniref:fructose-bisphosphate aldolase, class II n=1 Tax=Nannochloropsis gaditana (strain CCMP526) TaxID=1093141 RepID=UPI00029F677E|nr:fructose-bisphosphate aldolase, class II [Nannochloropsis gaditana CCMP526]EKU21683.1 fructose-bisphosphate aldolase, class II [Nannochloropsis gaditana CCMP526]|eukprot:XP_005854676.1 fructose-bisphosphate aldolase, class II [Nannochloropsis gaditana CCMP526]
MVLGPILPGVPVWECGEESKFPGMKYVVFPGNVGSSQALFEAAQKLCFPPSTSTPPSSDSKTSLASCVTPTRPVFASSSRTLDLLEAARAKGEAVGAFNVYNLEGVRAVVRAAAATNSSAILQVHPSSLEFGGQPLLELCRAGRFFVEEMGTMRGSKEKDTIAVHLDHANEAAVIEQVLATQLVDSVMCDGSAKPYEENVSWTAQMTRLAHSKGIPVEAELGRLAGEEDGLSVQEKEAKMTDPLQVRDFVEQTDIDMVAVTIGNVHGRYATNPPVLDLARLADIRAATDRLLVLHGASGLPPKVVHATIAIGAICKFNVNTEVREAAMQVIREGKAKDVLPLMQTTGEAMQRVIENKMRLFKASPSI